jgi:hypothetical protein
MVFRLFRGTEQITTRSNRDNIYVSLKNAKIALKQYLSWANKKILDKNLQVKAEDCKIIGFELVEKVQYQL